LQFTYNHYSVNKFLHKFVDQVDMILHYNWLPISPLWFIKMISRCWWQRDMICGSGSGGSAFVKHKIPTFLAKATYLCIQVERSLIIKTNLGILISLHSIDIHTLTQESPHTTLSRRWHLALPATMLYCFFVNCKVPL